MLVTSPVTSIDASEVHFSKYLEGMMMVYFKRYRKFLTGFVIYRFGCARLLSHVQLFAAPWTVTHQAPLYVGFSRQEHWSGLPFPTPEDLPNPGIEHCPLCLLHWQVDSLPLSHLGIFKCLKGKFKCLKGGYNNY